MTNTMNIVVFLMNILPAPPVGTPNELAESGIEFFSLWISRIGGFVAFAGAIKFALALNTEDSREQLLSVLTMVSGFMVKAAVNELNIFNIPAVYTVAAANAEFKSIMDFIGAWTRRVGAVGLLLGAVMFALAIKDNNAVTKISGLKTFIAGAIVSSVSLMLPQFV